MNYLIALFCTVVLAATVCESGKVHYDGYKVYRVEFETPEQFNILYQMDLNSQEVNFWLLSRQKHYADIMVAPGKIQHFLGELDSQGFKYHIVIENVEQQMKQQ